LTTYVQQLQPEFRINYCKLITVSVDDRMNTNEVRDALGADWPFLMDPDRRLLHELQMTDTTDKAHGEVYIPYTFILDRDRSISSVAQRSRRSAWTCGPSCRAALIGCTRTNSHCNRGTPDQTWRALMETVTLDRGQARAHQPAR